MEIISGLYLGTKIDSHNIKFLQSRNIKVIINVTNEIPFLKDCESIGIQSIRVPISDAFGEADKDKHNLEYSYQFGDLCKLIDNKLKQNINILVHCKHGKYRSTALIIAYLMYKMKMSLEEIYGLLKSKYNLVKMKKHIFLIALQKWEYDLKK